MLSSKHKALKLLGASVLLALSTSSFAEVVLTIPANVDIKAVNGQKPEISSMDKFLGSEKAVTLPDGTNQIVFNYNPIIHAGNDLVQVDTDTVVARFNASQTELGFEFPKYRNEREAREFDKNPDWKLVTKDGTAIDMQQDKLLKDGFQLGRNYVDEINEYNQKGGAAAVRFAQVQQAPAAPAPVVNTSSAAVPVVAASATTAAAVSASAASSAPVVRQAAPATSGQYKNTEEEMLHYWYQKADAETKQRFIREILN